MSVSFYRQSPANIRSEIALLLKYQMSQLINGCHSQTQYMYILVGEIMSTIHDNTDQVNTEVFSDINCD